MDPRQTDAGTVTHNCTQEKRSPAALGGPPLPSSALLSPPLSYCPFLSFLALHTPSDEIWKKIFCPAALYSCGKVNFLFILSHSLCLSSPSPFLLFSPPPPYLTSLEGRGSGAGRHCASRHPKAIDHFSSVFE